MGSAEDPRRSRRGEREEDRRSRRGKEEGEKRGCRRSHPTLTGDITTTPPCPTGISEPFPLAKAPPRLAGDEESFPCAVFCRLSGEIMAYFLANSGHIKPSRDHPSEGRSAVYMSRPASPLLKPAVAEKLPQKAPAKKEKRHSPSTLESPYGQFRRPPAAPSRPTYSSHHWRQLPTEPHNCPFCRSLEKDYNSR